MSAVAKLVASEQQVQRAVIEHLHWRAAEGCFAFHCPNGGFRRPTEAALFKSLGVVSGVPDIMLLHQARAFGLELKKERTGRLTADQITVHEQLRKAGATVETCWGIDEALDQLRQWGLLR